MKLPPLTLAQLSGLTNHGDGLDELRIRVALCFEHWKVLSLEGHNYLCPALLEIGDSPGGQLGEVLPGVKVELLTEAFTEQAPAPPPYSKSLDAMASARNECPKLKGSHGLVRWDLYLKALWQIVQDPHICGLSHSIAYATALAGQHAAAFVFMAQCSDEEAKVLVDVAEGCLE